MIHPLVKSARHTARLAQLFQESDLHLKLLMEVRYGYHSETPDPIVEAINYGHCNPKEITLDWLDQTMTEAGHPPLKAKS